MYDAQPQRDRHSFADYQEQGRRRGREVVAAVAAEHPDIAVPTYFIYGGLPGDPEAAAGARLEVDIYGLLPAFVEGMLAASTPSVTIVDGTESAYTFSELSQLQTAAVRLEVGGQRFVAPELRARFRAQTQIGLGGSSMAGEGRGSCGCRIACKSRWRPPMSTCGFGGSVAAGGRTRPTRHPGGARFIRRGARRSPAVIWPWRLLATQPGSLPARAVCGLPQGG